jgi:hypothetical protein
MTIQEFHLNFKFGLDKIDSLNYPDFLPEEIDLLLNQAQERFIKQRYGLNNVKRQSFEETQKRTEDLKNIIVATNLTPLAYNPLNIDSNARFVTLPIDHWFIIQERAEVSYNDCTGTLISKFVEVRPTQHVEFDKVVNDAFKAPDNTKILRLMENGQVELVSSPGITITQYRLRYLKQPVTMSLANNITCELSEHTHREIVDTAIVIALENIEAKRNNTFTPIIDNQKE